MKVISLNCNHCGAPLDVPAKARFATCGFCQAKLAVEHVGNSYSTSVLDELKETTEKIARDVAEMKSSSEIKELDERWQRERLSHMVTGKHGQQSLPTKTGAVAGGIMIAAFGLFWTIMAAGITSAGARVGAPGVVRIFPLFGVLFIGFGIFIAFRIFSRADAYERANKKYLDQRRELAREQTRTD
ncbi:hypothetical protein Mal15_53370 [Stieleria maiorica]|uniref:Zinc ribbon domain-containing protein n=1 Tax=Stieleria maiorica TaxID=2795974 RepID=A0A5B9MMK0_9BACT|nr:hypothetical protein [Stieleria maiorica]QEG01261.1 hypothetical protein Mal15_53370 [Stieleria maiorica]